MSLNSYAADEKSDGAGRASSPITNPNPGADLWKKIRGAGSGMTQDRSIEGGVLINSAGQDWRILREQKLIKYSSWALLAAILLVILFRVVHGQIKLEKGYSGQKIKRWSVYERTIHWFTAICFIILAISGLTTLLGRSLIIPVIGAEAFSYWASLMKLLHNYIGPFFSFSVLLVIINWMGRALPSKDDIHWLASGGGIIGHAHPSAGTLNAGEKGWFWIIATVGVVCSVTGLILDFADFGQTREDMQLANIVHSISAVAWMVVAMGHIYMGTIGTEGALEAMTTGEVDVNWAKQHHDLWYQQVTNQSGGTSDAGSSVREQEQPT
ncbi:formate dehydrogenase subunit gamma [Pseudomonadota bacterium]